MSRGRKTAWRRWAPALVCLWIPAAAGASAISIRESALVDLHFYIRALATDSAAVLPALEGIGPAVERARELDRALGSPLAWGIIEANLPILSSAAEAATRFAALPESTRTAGGSPIPIRRLAVDFARSLAQVEPAFLQSVWPDHRARTDRARARAIRDLYPRQAECFERIERDLALSAAPESIPVFFVARAPWPGAVTHRMRDGRGVCFIGVEADSAGLLEETILHESIHAIDVISEQGVLDDLRERLEARGLSTADRRLRDIPHTLIFIEAAETVRRLLEPAHRDYGEVSGYYRRMARIAEVERSAWREHLDGRLSREDALDRIVTDLVENPGGR